MYISILFGEINMKKVISVLALGLFLAGCCCHHNRHCHEHTGKCCHHHVHCHDVTTKICHEHGSK